MTLKELTEIQRRFDAEHEGKFQWDASVTNEDVSMLGFSLLALSGEVGEASNLVKKIWRGDFSLTEKREELQEELADIFSYLLKIAYQLNVDLESAYLGKNKKNQERFSNYAKENK